MRRRSFLKFAVSSGIAVTTGRFSKLHAATPTSPEVEKLYLSDAAWRERLTPEQYAVLRFGETEFAGSSELNHEYRAGTYVCAGCDLPLFKSDWKYNSRTGWPSFWQALDEHLTTRRPIYAFRAPTEYRCARCDGHHGHIFEDGPPPTGLRYCSNGAALKFIKA
ncbi:peptide-methionine (R)-S-oxide reductase MsrB [Pseudohongiella acticola]|uniref:peptide-methionine (R)-S-oxide reductase MsrB n=1 Tax=Pseudohongiella acticola TaxID=1524254 RepID=UPI0030EB382E